MGPREFIDIPYCRVLRLSALGVLWVLVRGLHHHHSAGAEPGGHKESKDAQTWFVGVVLPEKKNNLKLIIIDC